MPSGKVTFKERSARRAIRVARKEGLAINGVEIGPDGTIIIHTEPPDQVSKAAAAAKRDAWDAACDKPAT